MKTFSTAFVAALQAGAVLTAGAAKVEATSNFNVWGGAGVLTIDGDDYVGIGDAGFVSVSSSQVGGSQDGLQLVMSGVDPDTAGLIDTAGTRNARVTTFRLAFDLAGATLLDAQVFDRGRLDQLSVEENPGAPGTPAKSTLKGMVETAIRGLGRMTGRRTADADQRMILSTDRSCSKVTQAGQLTLAWGGKPPARAIESLPNGRPAGPGVFTFPDPNGFPVPNL